MSAGFRKSMFGFNCADVMHYIEESHKNAAQKQALLEEKLSSVEGANEQLKSELSATKTEKEQIERQLKEYTDKYDEIERLSQNIGKLYLVAQSNARAIMNSSAENREAARREVESNIESIDSAHTSLGEIRTKMIETSNEFVARLEQLMSSLSATRDTLDLADGESEKKINEFESLYSELTR